MVAGYKYVRRSEQKWTERANQTGGGFASFIKDEFLTFRPAKGEHHIRILPPTWQYRDGRDGDHFSMEIYVHYGVGPDNGAVLCLQRMRDKRCPLCENRQRAEQRGDEEEKNELKPIRRALMWVLNRKEQSLGTLVWAAPQTVDRDITKICRDTMTGVIYHLDDPDDGYDITFEREGEGRNTQYGAVRLARESSSVDGKYIHYILEHPLQDVLRWRTYEEVERMYKGGYDDDEEEAPQPRRRRMDDEDERPRQREDDAPPFRGPAEESRPRPRAKINDDVDNDRSAVGQDHGNVNRYGSRADELRDRFNR